MLFNTDKESMFFLINKKNEEIRRSENRMALRRAKRKMPKADSLRLVEGDNLSKALKAEERSIKEAATKKEAEKKAPKKVAKKTSKKEAPKKAKKEEVKIDKKAVKKEVKKHADKVAKTPAKKTVKKESVEAGSKVPSKVEASEGEKTNELF